MLFKIFTLCTFSLPLALSLPTGLTPRSVCPSNAGDAPYSVDCNTLAASITCPNGIKGATNGIVLLVHGIYVFTLYHLSSYLIFTKIGTGSTGSESWQNGPYVQLLPARANVDVCYVTMPGRTLGDAEVSAEYVAYNIGALAAKSATKKVAVIGHSQGNINIQVRSLYLCVDRVID